jgi:hypothetical protein
MVQDSTRRSFSILVFMVFRRVVFSRNRNDYSSTTKNVVFRFYFVLCTSECHLLSKMSRFECCVFVFLSSSSNVYQNGIITCMFFLSHRRRKKLYRDNISASETARAHSAVPPRSLRSVRNNNLYLFSCCNGTRDSPPRWRLSSSSSPSSFFFSSSISFSCL